MTTPSPTDHLSRATLELGFGEHDAVAATPHHLATETAVAVMTAGGNAVDGAIAANAVLGVVLPDTCGLGGDLFALVHRPGMAAPTALNASGFAGSGVSADRMRRRGQVEMPLLGPETVTVPGCVDGWEALLTAHGTWRLGDLLAPAIGLARGGFAVSVELAAALAPLAARFGDLAPARPLFPGGAAPAAGEMVSRPDLAATLEVVADGGRDAFFGGLVGEGIVAATGGLVTPADLAVAQAEWVEPVGARIHGLDAWTLPPNSQGYLTLATLLVAGLSGAGADPDDPAAHHRLVEAYRTVAAERDDLVADPATAPLAPGDLLDPARLAVHAASMDTQAPGRRSSPRRIPGGTAFLCTRDRDGMGVSLIQSNFHGIGSGLGAGDTGVFLHNRGAGFNLIPGHPNELRPHRRPMHTLSPTLWTEAHEDRCRLRLLLGTRGGHYQPQILAQVASRRLAAGLDLVESVAAPRWVVDPWAAVGSKLHVESRMPAPVVDGLRRSGHVVDVAGPWEPDWGPVAAIEIGERGGTACGDPRVSTSGVSAS